MARGENQAPNVSTASRSQRAPRKGKSAKKQSWWQSLSPEEQQAHLEAKREQVSGLKEQLDKRLEDLTADEFVGWLRELPRMYRYSLNNYLLLRWQNPDATRVQAASAWKREGRLIKKGERALRVLGPRDVWVKDGEELDEHGEPKRKKILVFEPLPVFDISQTQAPDGEEAVESAPDVARGLEELRELAESRGVRVFLDGVDEPTAETRWLQAGLLTDPNANGFYGQRRRVLREGGEVIEQGIAVRSGLSDEQRLRVLAHEVAHQSAGHLDPEETKDAATKELEAEAVAYVIAGSYGAESDYSPNYLTAWGGGEQARAKVQELSKGIQQLARDIFQAIDERRQA